MAAIIGPASGYWLGAFFLNIYKEIVQIGLLYLPKVIGGSGVNRVFRVIVR